jgi:phosphohistidine phosphatase
MGVWLLQQRLQPDYVISSPAERAVVTAQKTVKTMGGDARSIHQDRRIYAANVEELLQVLSDISLEYKRVMLVGHNPGLEMLTEYLHGERIPLPADGKLIPTATLALIEMPDDWRDLKSGDGELLSIVRPSSIDKKFPFPDEHGTEMRDRPAYYYTQSSVIPYRVKEGEVEILVVMSSKRKHWVLPKGISEPALSLRESAAKEALEEAGIEGEVAEEAIGSYTYEKWGAQCTVNVYPMRVTRELPENEWEENHRGREWLAPKVAAKKIKQMELKPMIQALAKQLKR